MAFGDFLKSIVGIPVDRNTKVESNVKIDTSCINALSRKINKEFTDGYKGNGCFIKEISQLTYLKDLTSNDLKGEFWEQRVAISKFQHKDLTEDASNSACRDMLKRLPAFIKNNQKTITEVAKVMQTAPKKFEEAVMEATRYSTYKDAVSTAIYKLTEWEDERLINSFNEATENDHSHTGGFSKAFYNQREVLPQKVDDVPTPFDAITEL